MQISEGFTRISNFVSQAKMAEEWIMQKTPEEQNTINQSLMLTLAYKQSEKQLLGLSEFQNFLESKSDSFMQQRSLKLKIITEKHFSTREQRLRAIAKWVMYTINEKRLEESQEL